MELMKVQQSYLLFKVLTLQKLNAQQSLKTTFKKKKKHLQGVSSCAAQLQTASAQCADNALRARHKVTTNAVSS